MAVVLIPFAYIVFFLVSMSRMPEVKGEHYPQEIANTVSSTTNEEAR